MGYLWLPGLMAILRGVEPHEVNQALAAARRWPRPTRDQHGITYITVFARTAAGRPIIVVLHAAGGHDHMIVAARAQPPTRSPSSKGGRNSMDDFGWQDNAQADRMAQGLADGSIQLTYDDAAPVPVLPPVDTPVSVVRPIRLPFDVDEAVRRIAEQRGVSVSVVLREWIVAGLEAGGAQPDPVTELRRSLDVAQRALSRIADAA